MPPQWAWSTLLPLERLEGVSDRALPFPPPIHIHGLFGARQDSHQTQEATLDE